MNNYELLKPLQKVELEILKEFISVCEKLNLIYYLDSGTLLGCIRHHGFIPWDDDIDVSMPRKDYDIFLKKGQKMMNNRYFIQTYKTDKEYTNTYAKIRDCNTTFIEKTVKSQKINHGVFIDIFPLDNYNPNKKYYNSFNTLKENLIKHQIRKRYFLNTVNTVSFRKKIRNYILDMFYKKYDLNELLSKKEKMEVKLKDKETNYYYCYSYFNTKVVFPKEIFGKGVLRNFEGIKARVPKDYDRYLKIMYGDYMKLPPVEKRVAHHYNEIIDLEKSYKEYIK